MLTIVLLAGGRGTRIRGVLGDTPKVLARVRENTVLDYITSWLESSFAGYPVEMRIATGIGHDIVYDFVERRGYKWKCCKESKPLGTFGAALNACVGLDDNQDVMIINGDTLVSTSLEGAYRTFRECKYGTMLVVKAVDINERYGGYCKNSDGLLERQTSDGARLVSTGCLFTTVGRLRRIDSLLDKPKVQEPSIDDVFLTRVDIQGYVLEDGLDFVDIGVPESYAEAGDTIPKLLSKALKQSG